MSLKTKPILLSLSVAILLAMGGNIWAKHETEKSSFIKESGHSAGASDWMAGDFHQHTLYTDGSNTFFTVMAENAKYGLDWWANSEHGGERNRDGEGVYWDSYEPNPILGWYEESGGHQEMWRWQSLRDYVFPDILVTRDLYQNKRVINGLEWNVPGHEHCSTGIVADDASAISAFEYQFDASDSDFSLEGEETLYGTLVKTNGYYDFTQLDTYVASTSKTSEEQHADSVAAVAWMQAQKDAGKIADGYIVFAHIERVSAYTVDDFRDYNNAGPDVAIGFEGAPGHQTSGDRGFGRSADGGGTYGGVGWYTANVGGLWDALLGEGRNWWNFASSDYHNHWSDGGSDFWPGEYQKNYTYINQNNNNELQAVVEGLRSGATWHVEGDLIDKLEFTASSEASKQAMMGQTLKVKKGDTVTLKIKVHDPEGSNHCPLNMDNPSLAQIGISQPLSMPVLDHVDLIAGRLTGLVAEDDEAYTLDINASTQVVATFGMAEGEDADEAKDDEGEDEMTFVYRFKARESMYFRLRGTNLPVGVPLETDEDGNPLPDSEASDNLYSLMDPATLEAMLFEGVEINTNSKLDEVAEAYADLWFYSNPIYIQVIDGKKKHK